LNDPRRDAGLSHIIKIEGFDRTNFTDVLEPKVSKQCKFSKEEKRPYFKDFQEEES
jgi:hypothetical protein